MPDALTLSVTDLAPCTPTTRRLRLALGDVPFTYLAGQGVALGLHGQGERRPYSIASAPADTCDTGELEFLLRLDALGNVGRHLDGVAPGARVDVEGPFGSFTLPDPLPASPLIFFGGGTGIAPLRSLMRGARAAGHAGPMHLVYSVRTADDVAYADEWHQWTRDGLGEVTVVVTRPHEGRAEGHLARRIAVPDLETALARAPQGLCFVCGPPGFVDDLVHGLSQLGVRADRIRREGW